MRFHTLFLTFALVSATTSAYKVSFKQKQTKHRPTVHRRGEDSASASQQNVAGGDVGLDLSTVHDLIYMANITLGNNDFVVQLDTGSSDLWIKGPPGMGFPLPNTHPTQTTHNLSYVIGSVFGNVSFAAVEFAGMSIPSQAFLDISSAENPALQYGANGVVGLGFTSLSTIDAQLNSTRSSAGRSLLYNLFEAHPSEPNFLAFALQRSTEQDDEVEGSFSIGEFEPKYAAVANQTAISTWPPRSPSRWNVLLDAVIVGERIIVPSDTSVPGAPSNKAVVLMDSGSSYTYAPKAICDAIYYNITGAQFDVALGQWVVPCSYEIDMALQIGGQIFPIHPLDVTPNGLVDRETCVGSFIPSTSSVGAKEFDWLIGDNFLRSVYSVYDFGDFDSEGKMGNPYMKLLPIIDADEASINFHKIRGGQPKTNITYKGLDGISVMPSFNISEDISESLERIGRYLPAMLAVVALNALILIALVVAGVVICYRKRNPAVPARTTRGRLSPMPLSDRNTYIPGSGTGHGYQPVYSMAISENDSMFVAPSPAFHNYDGNTLRPGDRPKSVA